MSWFNLNSKKEIIFENIINMTFNSICSKVIVKFFEPLKYRFVYWKKTKKANQIMSHFDNSNHYVFIQFYDSCRLGNQMFFISFGENLRKLFGWEVKFWTKKDNFIRFVEPFVYEKFDLYINDNIDYSLHIEEWDWKTSPKIVEKGLSNGNVLISGSYEDLTLHDLSICSDIFKCPNEICNTIHSIYGDLSFSISIHVRRGDFVFLGIALSAEYYKKAFGLIRERIHFQDKIISVIVISDDIKWCKENIRDFEGAKIIFADRHKRERFSKLIDLYLPTFCQLGNIISCSTFSFWGTALNQTPSVLRVQPIPWWNGKSQLYFRDSIKLEAIYD